MSQAIATIGQFSFRARELSQQLLRCINESQTGTWEIKFDRATDRESEPPWYLSVVNGKIFYTGNCPWSAQRLMAVIYRYASHTRNDLVKTRFEQIDREITEKNLAPAQALTLIQKIGIVNNEQLIKALKMQILDDLDLYAISGSGNAKLMLDLDITSQLPVMGFDLSALLTEFRDRQVLWEKIQHQVPSLNLIPMLNRTALAKSNLPDGQQQRITKMVDSQQSLQTIAQEMAKDRLEIAEMFARLVKGGLIALVAPNKDTPAPIMVIDDSPLMLSQFQHWVDGLGYGLVTCQQSETALAKIVEVEPAVIFIDINMPGLSGFELVKQIRKQPQLSTIPLVILTGEQNLSNRWRAQWSGCTFLSKPLESTDVDDFQIRLKELILKLVGTAKSVADRN
jgi:CheY-like chemotaxis protein